jgi:hypothetical protein
MDGVASPELRLHEDLELLSAACIQEHADLRVECKAFATVATFTASHKFVRSWVVSWTSAELRGRRIIKTVRA